MSKNKIKVIMAAQFPEPIHGASLRNFEFYTSEYVNNNIFLIKHEIQTAKNINDIGGVSILKLMKTLIIIISGVLKAIVHKPDIFYITLSTSGIAFWKDSILAFLCKPFTKKLFVHFRCFGLEKYLNSRFKLWWAKFVFHDAYALVLSDSLRNEAETIIHSSKVKVVGNCIDTNEFINIAKKSSQSDNIDYYHIANLSEEKGSLLVLRAFSQIDFEKYNIRLNLIGPWHDEKCKLFYNELLVNKPSLHNNIIYHGPLYGKDKMNLISKMNVHLFPSKYKKECFPGVILEAMFYSIPTVATKHAAIPDMVIDMDTGFLIEKNDIESLIEKIEYYHDNRDAVLIHGYNANTLYQNNFTKDNVHGEIIREFISSVKS